MVKRGFQAMLHRLLRRFPVVTVLGPRQCGKTTFIRQALPAWTYLDLERPSPTVSCETAAHDRGAPGRTR